MALMDSRQAADFLQLKGRTSWKTVEKWARDGKLRGGKAGDLWRFTEEDLTAFLFANGKKR